MSKSSSDGSVAPKERINITYKPALGGQGERVELPIKTLVIGDFSHKKENTSLEDRELIDVNANNLDTVLNSMGVNLNFAVENKLDANSEDIGIDLDIKSMKDFRPDHIVNSIKPLKKILEIRESLSMLKGPIGNDPKVRAKIKQFITDQSQRKKLIKELEHKK